MQSSFPKKGVSKVKVLVPPSPSNFQHLARYRRVLKYLGYVVFGEVSCCEKLSVWPHRRKSHGMMLWSEFMPPPVHLCSWNSHAHLMDNGRNLLAATAVLSSMTLWFLNVQIAVCVLCLKERESAWSKICNLSLLLQITYACIRFVILNSCSAWQVLPYLIDRKLTGKIRKENLHFYCILSQSNTILYVSKINHLVVKVASELHRV